MALRSDTRVIGEHTYYCMQLPARRALDLKARIIAMLGGSLSPLVMGIGKSKEEQAAKVADALSLLFADKDPGDVVDLLVDVCCMATVDKKLMDGNKFDEVFSEDLTDAYSVFAFVLEVNFGNLFKGQLERTYSQLVGQSQQ